MQINKQILEGHHIRLEPLNFQRHVAGLSEAIFDGELWKLGVTFVPHPKDLPSFFMAAEAAYATQKELAFATIDIASGKVIGSTRFRNIEVPHKRVEIGFTFLSKSWQRTHANSEAKLLMLQHAFEIWEVNRVEFLTDFLNTASRNAIQRIGGTQEGILRSHMVMRDGRIRDSVLFGLVSSDWPKAKQALLDKLSIRRD